MGDNFIHYEFNGKRYKIPTDKKQDFESKAPDAKMMLTFNGKSYGIPLSEVDNFIGKAGVDNVTYSEYDNNKEYSPKLSTRKYMSFEAPDNEVGSNESVATPVVDKTPSYIDAIKDPNLSGKEKRKIIREAKRSGEMPNTFETIGKSIGTIGTSIGGMVVDAANLGLKMSRLQNPVIGLADMMELKTGVPVPEELRSQAQVDLDKASEKLQGATEKLSMGADPTGGQMDFVELVKAGRFGLAMQKGLGSTIESAPMMVASRNPYTAAIYMVGMAASNYADETRENPDIPMWKRAANAAGSAALEMAIEKVADPLKSLLGNGASALTEEAAKEIIEKATKEGVQTISKRILRALGNTIKDAAGEGLEEVGTSLGNDALGSALDAIDKDRDYGFKAQWEEYKAQNPNATKGDFANAKAKEYLNSFLGGALSGVYMSGFANAVKETQDARARKQFDDAYTKGTTGDYRNLYDVDDAVKRDIEKATKAFTSEDGTQSLSEEYIAGLSAEAAFALSRNMDLPAKQRLALGNLAIRKAQQEGLNNGLNERVDGEVNANRAIINGVAENGNVVIGRYNGKPVYVKGGVAKNGTVTLPSGEAGPVVVINTQTGEKQSVNSKDIVGALTRNAEELANEAEQIIRGGEQRARELARNTMSPLAKLNSVRPYAGKKILVNLGNGVTEVYVQQVSPNGEVLIKGKKGDLGGQSFLTLNSSAFYDSIHRDAEGNPTITDVGKEEQEQYDAIDTTEPTQTPEADVDGTEDFKEKGTHTILIAGKPVEVEVTYHDNASDTVNYEYVDESGNRKVGSTTVGGFKAAIQQAEQYKPTESPAPENENPTPVEPIGTDVTAETTQAPTEVPVTPETIDWDALFENDAEAYFTEMQNQFGDKTAKRLVAVVAATQKKLDALNKATPETDNEIFENEEKKEKLEAKIEALNGMIARLSAEPVSEVAPTTPAPVETAPVQPMAPTTVQPEGNIPDVSVDKAADARARGFRMTNGQRVDRRGETTGVYGNDTDVTFTSDSKGKRTGKVKVIDAGNLVPSHIGGVENVEHFLPEAQPKKRTDAASTVSATLIAQNMDNPKMTNVASSAYEGAPIVNKRGEVIQGNNRSAAIIEMYQAHQQKAAEYKQYLIDHAAEFGLNADEVAAMQNPVLVRELDVDDADAITLGQYTMQDMESGGSQMIDSGRAIAVLSNKGMLEDFIARLLSEENEETSDMNLSDLITRNGNEALKMLYQNGIINQTQYQSALGANGRITADARAALRGIVEQQLFAGGIDNLSVMFEVLPDKAKKAIMQTISRDLKNPDDAKVTPYLQEAIEIYYQLNQQPDFVAAKTEEEVVAAIELFKGQTSLEEAGTPAEKYSNFAFELAKSFKVKTLKQQREYLNALYDAIAGVADIFGESEGKSLSEAVEEIYGTNLNKGNNETNGKSGIAVLEGGNGGSQEGQQGSTENVGVRPETGESGQGTTNGGANPTVGGGTQTTGEVTPVAPIPVANPVDAAKSKERHLKNIIARYDLTPEHKYDLAVQIGKEIGDFFATIEEYEAFEAYATDFGAEYNRAVKEGVDKSFAERAQNTGNSQENGVSLGTEPSGGNNGTEAGTETPESTEGYNGTTGGQHTDDEGGEEGTQEAEGLRGGDTNQEIKYPARNGDATRQLLMDTFGFVSVSPGISQENLNHIYDFLMEMSKMLGISPTSISHGATLGMGVLGGRSSSTLARYEYRATWDGTIKEPYIRFKNSLLSSIAHEWWHSLDQVLSYYETGRGKKPATTVSANEFTGRPEVLDAIREVLKAINKSGHKERLETEYKDNPDYLAYSKRKKELAARFFEGYIKTKFAEAGIVVNGFAQNQTNTPTAEELKPVIPAFDNLFNVLREKEGKNEGSTVLYHIGQEVDEAIGEASEAQQLVVDALMETLDGYVDTVIATDEQTQAMLDVRDELSGVELMTVYHGSPHKFDAFDHSHMGEGEGAQAHGWGTYVAKSRETSVAYARMGRVTYIGPKVNYGSYEYEVVEDITAIMRNGNTFDEAIQIGRRYWNNLKWEPSHRAKRAFLDTLRPEDFQLRSLYTVEIPEDDGSNYFDERTLSKEQTDRFVEACEKEGIDWVEVISEASEPVNILNNPNQGKRLYNSLIKTLGSDKAVSEFLSRAGFVGIKYDGRRDGECFVIFNEADAKIVDRVEFYQTPNGTVYGWTDGKKIYLTKAGINPNTPIHEYTHLWAKAMMQKNPKGWNRIKQLLKGTPVWDEVMNDANYSNIHGDEDAVASEVLSRISGSENAAKMEHMAQKMIDEAKGSARKLEARGLIQNMKDALNMFWEFVWKDLFKMTYFRNVEHVTDRVLFDLLNQTDLGELSEGQVETQIVTDPEVIAELEASPKVAGFRNVVQNEDGTFSSPMAYWLQSTKEGAKSRVETAKFELGKWEEAEEHPELVDENGKVTLVKPNKSTVDGVAYDPYIHNRLEPVNLQFKDAWKRDDLVYVETEVAENDLNDGYHADKALLPVGIHSWSNGDVMLSRYDKPVRVMSWEEVADALVKRLNGEGVHFDVVPPAMRSLLVERGVEILPPHKGMGKKCNDAYKAWKEEADSDGLIFRSSDSPITPEMDSAYLKAVEAGDMETAQRMVIEAARLAMPNTKVIDEDGNPKVVYHGTGSEFYTFRDTSDSNELGAGYYFSDSYEMAERYATDESLADNRFRTEALAFEIFTDEMGHSEEDYDDNEFIDDYNKSYDLAVERLFGNGHVKSVFLNLENPRILSRVSPDFDPTYRYGFNHYNEGVMAKRFNDGVIDEMFTERHEGLTGNQYVAFSPSQIKSADPVTYDDKGHVIPLSQRFNPENPDIRYRKSDAQNVAVDYLAGDARLKAIENAVNEEAKKLGVKVTYKTREEMPKGHKNDKGYYNTKTGEIVICTENASSIADAIHTILHEAVAHKGLRQLMGDKFNEFISRVYNALDAETKAKVDKLASEQYNGNTALAMEEYMASLAETENFADQTIWEKIKSIFTNLINDILGRNDIKIGDNELRYILRASYNNMVNPRSMETIEGWAKDQLMREEYKVNESTPEILSRTGIDPTEVASETARQVYDKTVNETWQEFQRQFQDAYQPVRIAIDAIQQETGNVPIEDYENFLLIQNQMSSRSRVEIDKFQRRYYSPIISQVNAIIDTLLAARGLNVKDKAKRAEVYKEVINYLIAKHGIERNKYYQSTKTRKMTAKEMKPELDEAQADYQQKVDMINMNNNLSDAERELQLRDALDEYNAVVQEIKSREVPDMRDYSGLTSLFGLDSKEYKEAERMAQEMVDNFEKSLGRVDNEDGEIVEQSEAIDKMWEKINKATDKTLRHSYESGLLSRQQYNDIKAMFKFYIPLRGFDETTAEDVYSYARFEGNRFNPAVQTAKGRTSVADDPIAIIMNMAESEIAQGNKNRAKQALYNYLLNRTIIGEDGKEHQNSLMQVEDVWYVKGVDSEGNEIYQIATPDRSRGESWEEFEVRMQTMAEEGNAYKSKKGKLDVGMRFQKQRNQGAHYVYLKVNGVEKAIYINGDPKAADAINGTYRPEINAGVEKMRELNRLVSSTFTNYSLEFTARNYFRDMIYSHINIGIKESDPAYRKKFRQNWRHNNLRTVKNMLQAYRNGEYEGRPLTEDEAAFVEFMENGGQTGYTLINSVESRKKDLERAIKNMQNGSEGGGVKDTKAFKATLGAIELLNESSELVTRFAAFKTSRDMGRSINKSISDAKEITVNFNTKGAQDGKGLAGFIARYFGWSKYFFNASVQGVQNIKAMAEANKLKFCSAVGGIAGLGFCMPIIAGALSELFGGDDDDENAYWNIPEYDRQNNLCIPVGNTYLKIPLPIGFREVYAIGDMVAAMAFDKKFTRDVSQVGMDIANKIASTVLPINPLESSANGLNFWHTFLYTALPSSAQFAIQNATNLDWKGVPLQKEYTYNEDDPQWMKAYASNPDWMVTVAKWCNENTQFGDYEGWDWSPEKLDNTLSNMFGGIYTIVKKTGKTISMAWNEENRTTSNIPLAGVVLGSGIGSDDMYMTDAYYDMLEYYDSNVNLIKRRAKQFGFDLDDVFVRKKGAHQPKMQKDVYSNPTFEWMQEWYKGNKELEKYDDNVKKLEKKIAESDKPSETNIRRLNRARLQFEQERREFINDMLELD